MTLKIHILFLLVLLLIILGVAGQADYHAQQFEDKEYVEMVCRGDWPDYKNWKPACEREVGFMVLIKCNR